MAAKLLHSLTDDNLDLQKQIGCMNGIFQLFDRPHILTGGRHVSHKGLHQGISDYNGATPVGEANHDHLRSASTEKTPVKNVQEKQRISNASSRASLSRSSSSSSLDCIRATHLESASLDRIIFPTMSFQNSSPQFSRNIRDLVKDSMYREKAAEDPVMKKHSEMMDDVKVVSQHQGAPRQHHSEGRRLVRSLSYHSRDEYQSLISRDAPRFSYDGREANLDSKDVSLKLPRLSLDASKAGPMQQDSGQSARPPSVVAKLMGLETLPHTNSSVAKTYPDKDKSRPFGERETNSPRWRSPDSSMKPLSRFPLEPAPWKHTEGRRRRSSPKTTRDAAKASVYSEMEKRLKDLEFTQSGKDLRALKQILEAMQSKKLLQTQKQDHELRSKHEARSADRRKPHTDQQPPLASTKRPSRPAKDPSSKSSHRQSVKNDTTLKAPQISTRSQQLVKDGNAGLGKSSGAISPRLLEKRARPPPPPPPDPTKFRRQHSKQLGEANSPGGRRRPKHSNIQESGDKLSENERMMVRSVTRATNSVEEITVEHSSPVSVLDNTEDSPSSFTYKVNKLQNNVVEKLVRLNEAGTDYIASTYPDHRYISEILIASGLLLGSTLTDFQFQPSGHPINPEVFLVLEQMQTKEELTSSREKRRLVFDTVNEILGRKLVAREPWLSRTAVDAQKLLGELCCEIEALQGRSGEDDERWKGVVCKDVMCHESGCWRDFDGQVSGAVLDIERSIFKDLVNEIVIGEAATAAAAASGLKIKPVGRRKAFAN